MCKRIVNNFKCRLRLCLLKKERHLQHCLCNRMSVMKLAITIIFTSGLCPIHTLAPDHCFQGTFVLTPPLGGGDVCELCKDGTFMPLRDHAYRECFNCTQIVDPNVEILVEPCNRTQDAKIHCVNGCYRSLPRNFSEKGKCLKCTKCEFPLFETFPCQTYNNAVCCYGQNSGTYVNSDGKRVCQKRPWLCRQGQYFDLSLFHCQSCPKNTFMSLDYHAETECSKCQNPSEDYLPLHAVIAQECNSTHQAVLACKEGYYVNHSMGYRSNDIGCSPCTLCNTSEELYEGRECDQFHDTVCCPRPNMTVFDSSNGTECLEALADGIVTRVSPTAQTLAGAEIRTCGQNEYLYTNISDNSALCMPCRNGTYMNELKHTKAACKPCHEFHKSNRLPPTCPANEINLGCPQNDVWGLSHQNMIVILIIFCLGLVFSLAVTIIHIHVNYRISDKGNPFPEIKESKVFDKTVPNPCVNNSSPRALYRHHSQEPHDELQSGVCLVQVDQHGPDESGATEEDPGGETSALLTQDNLAACNAGENETEKGSESQSIEMQEVQDSSHML